VRLRPRRDIAIEQESTTTSTTAFSRRHKGPMGWLAALVELLRGLWLWCFSPRLTLDGGMVVYRGAWLAEGGFSTVYTGADAASGRPLALKFVRVGDREQHDAALREVRAHRRVDDAHVLELLDAAVLQLRGPAWFGPTAQFAVLAFPRMTYSVASRKRRRRVLTRVRQTRLAAVAHRRPRIAARRRDVLGLRRARPRF